MHMGLAEIGRNPPPDAPYLRGNPLSSAGVRGERIQVSQSKFLKFLNHIYFIKKTVKIFSISGMISTNNIKASPISIGGEMTTKDWKGVFFVQQDQQHISPRNGGEKRDRGGGRQ